MQAGAHSGAVRAARAEAAGGRRVRVAGAAAPRARPRAAHATHAPHAPYATHASHAPHARPAAGATADASREPQRERGCAQAALVCFRRLRG